MDREPDQPLEITGVFDDATQRMLCKFLNDSWDTAGRGVRERKLRGNNFGKVAVKALQTFLAAALKKIRSSDSDGIRLPIDGQVSMRSFARRECPRGVSVLGA